MSRTVIGVALLLFTISVAPASARALDDLQPFQAQFQESMSEVLGFDVDIKVDPIKLAAQHDLFNAVRTSWSVNSALMDVIALGCQTSTGRQILQARFDFAKSELALNKRFIEATIQYSDDADLRGAGLRSLERVSALLNYLNAQGDLCS